MSTLTLPARGRCRCGRIEIEISAAPLLTMACHCTGCQRMTSSAFSVSAAIPTPGFKVVQGAPAICGLHGDDAHHYGCAHCFSWMFTKAVGIDHFVNVRPTMLDDPSWFSPFMETWTSEKLPWASTGAAHSFAQLPAMDDYAALTAAYLATV
ncbi:MAG TPA: GFA family protein [Myxococcota bacterium]